MDNEKILRVTIDIKPRLIKHWGGIVINNFAIDHKSGEVFAENLTVPGFDYALPENQQEATFTMNTEVLDVQRKPERTTGKNRTTKSNRGGRKKVPAKLKAVK